MKKIAFILFTSLFLCIQNGFAQIASGTYYTAYGLLGRIVQIDIEETSDKGLKFRFEGIDYVASLVSDNHYQGEENSCQLKLRDDKDLELYTMLVQYGKQTDYVSGAYLLTANKAEAKDRWKKVKGTINPLIGKEMKEQEDVRLAYYYKIGNETEYIKLAEPFTGANKVKIFFGRYTDRTFEKLIENTYIYSRESSDGEVELEFARFFPTENKIIVYRYALEEDRHLYIAQLKNTPAKNEADDKKAKEFLDYIKAYASKYRIAFFNNFKANTSADIPPVKMNALVKGYFEEGYTVLKTKLITSSWTLTRNEFGRVLNRLQNIVVYLKENKTGKCFVAFRQIGQEFDGSSYGELLIYRDSSRGFTVEDDKKNSLIVYLLTSEYEIPCNELTK